MIDLLQTLIEILKINCSAVNCYYSNMLEGMFYLFFLPIILLVVFVFLIFSNLKLGHKGINLIIALAVLIFIVINGYFTIFISLSYIWIIGVIVLGIWRARKAKEEGGGQRASQMPGAGTVTKYIGRRTKAEISGEKRGLEEQIDAKLNALRENAKKIKKESDIEKRAKLIETTIRPFEAEIRVKLKELDGILRVDPRAPEPADIARRRRDLETILADIGA